MRQTHTARTPPINRMLGLWEVSAKNSTGTIAAEVFRFYYKPIAPSCAELSELLWLGWLETNCSAALDLQISSPAASCGKAHSIIAAIRSGLLWASKECANFLSKTEYYWLPSFRGSPGSLFCIRGLRFFLISNEIGNFVESLGRYQHPSTLLGQESLGRYQHPTTLLGQAELNCYYLGFLGEGNKAKHL